MKTTRKIFSLFLAVLIMASLCLCTFAADDDDIYIRGYAPQSYVTVAGNAGLDYINYEASMMLVKMTADLDNLEEDDIAYIGQTTIDTDGDYLFEIKFTGFTDDNEDSIVDNYKVILNVAGKNITSTVTQAESLLDLVQFDLDMSQFGNAMATITNEYEFKDLEYTMLIGFYDDDNTLLGLALADKFTGDISNMLYAYRDIPIGTSYAKGFIWENTKRMIPLAGVEEFDILGYTTNREAQCLTMGPGIDETERNFAWYDLPGIDGARIQYAVKTSDADLVTFPEENAVTIEGTCGDVDMSEYVGIPLREGKPEEGVFTHSGAYSWAKATIADLEYGTEYVYRVGDQLGWCKGIYEFKTDVDPSEGFNMMLFSDEHSTAGKAKQPLLTTSAKAFETMPDASLVYAMGDNVDLPWPEDAYNAYFDREYMTRLPLATVPGTTHDMYWSNREISLHGYHFNMPNRATLDYEDSRVTENVGANYWFVYGDVLFVALLHNGTTATDHAVNQSYIKRAVQEAEAQYPNIKWKVLCTHFPFWGSTEIDKYFPNNESDFISDCGIDVVFNGHSHVSYRSHQMYGNGIIQNTAGQAEVTDPKGTVYVSLNTTGFRANGATEQFYRAFADTTPTISYYDSASSEQGIYHTHFSTVEVVTTDDECSFKLTTYKNTCDRVTAEIKNTEIIDTYKIIKTK